MARGCCSRNSGFDLKRFLGQIVMGESVHDAVSAEFPNVESIEIDAKGKTELIKARVLTIG